MSEIHMSNRRASRSRPGRDEELDEAQAERRRSLASLAGVDKPLLYVTIALSLLGLVAVYSASATEAMDQFGNSFYYGFKQLIYLVAGFGAMWAISKVPYTRWGDWAIPISLGVIGLLVLTMLIGTESYGAARWLSLPGGFQFQPSELGKISVVLLLASYFGRRNHQFSMHRDFWLTLILCGITIGLIYEQPSLSMTIILCLTMLGMMLAGGIPWWLLTPVSVAGLAVVTYKVMQTEYQMRRIRGWWDPLNDPQDTSYQLVQSLYAIASGGLFGRGLGMSHQKLYYLPFPYSDFVFAVWAEEWGLVGCLVLMALFITLLYRGYVIARNCQQAFGQLLAVGFTLVLGVQTIVNIAVTTGFFPTTGVTLPLISYGGTSILVTLGMIGILLNISRYRSTVSQIPSR